MFRQVEIVLMFGVIGMFTFAEPAQAYLDPGTGSMVLQGLLGAAAAGLYAAKLHWARLKAFFGARSPTKVDRTEE